MEVVNLCKLLPGSCGHQVPGRDCQDGTVAARNNTSPTGKVRDVVDAAMFILE